MAAFLRFCLLGLVLVQQVPSVQAEAELPVVRVAVLKFGTANWELELMRHEGLDREYGFRLELLQRREDLIRSLQRLAQAEAFEELERT